MSNNAISQSYLNEYKGNLLEFLVAKELAKSFCLEKKFYNDLDRELQTVFLSYEADLRHRDPHLLKKLPIFAKKMASLILDEIKGEVDRIEVIGKKAQYGEFKEADILVLGKDMTALSLKMCKYNCYINTKSGGVRSFFKKYFNHFQEATNDQQKLNHQLDIHFSKMGFDLYESQNLDYEGKIGRDLVDVLGTELPGQLEGEPKFIVHNFYYSVMKDFFKVLSKYYLEDKKKFLNCLYPLLGFGNDKIIQVMALYKNQYELEKVVLKKKEDLLNNDIELCDLNESKSFFEIKVCRDILQIRLKPMNKFTVSGLKVNCSVKIEK